MHIVLDDGQTSYIWGGGKLLYAIPTVAQWPENDGSGHRINATSMTADA